MPRESERKTHAGRAGQARQSFVAAPLFAQPAAGDQPENHRAERRDEAERKIAAAVRDERFRAGEKIQEPLVERRTEIRVFVPMRREAARVIRPVRRHADFCEIKVGRRDRIQRPREPITEENHAKRRPLHAPGKETDRKQKRIAETDLRERVIEGPVRPGPPERAQKHAEQDQQRRTPARVRGHRGARLSARNSLRKRRLSCFRLFPGVFEGKAGAEGDGARLESCERKWKCRLAVDLTPANAAANQARRGLHRTTRAATLAPVTATDTKPPNSLPSRSLRRLEKRRFRKTCIFGNHPPLQRRSRLAANRRVVLLGPFGEPLASTGMVAAEMPFWFSTKYQDAETGLLYYIHRYYEPITGRWISRDPIGEDGATNLYSFVLNDPNRSVDVLGHFLLRDPVQDLREFLAKQAFYEVVSGVWFKTAHWKQMLWAWYYEKEQVPYFVVGEHDQKNKDIMENIGFKKMLSCLVSKMDNPSLPITGLGGGSKIDSDDRSFYWHYSYQRSGSPGGSEAYTEATNFLGSYYAKVTKIEGHSYRVRIENDSGWTSATAIPFTAHKASIWRSHPRDFGVGWPFLPSRGGNMKQYYIFKVNVCPGDCKFP